MALGQVAHPHTAQSIKVNVNKHMFVFQIMSEICLYVFHFLTR